MWFPSQSALEDLSVTETDEGLTLSAPDGTECADWLSHYNSSEELQAEFTSEMIQILEDHLLRLGENGSEEQVPLRIPEDRGEAQVD